MTHQPGAILHHRYRIVKMLGQGGFGTMYRAWDTTLGRVCALKENLDNAVEIQRQFLREAKILANLNHPNLPRVTDYFIEGAGQYLVMDFVEGQNLQEMLDDHGGPLAEDRVLVWVRQICDALTYLHGQKLPVIHRDIKPGNIKITPDGRAVLVDFGIAKVYERSSKTTVGAQAVTPGFSPYEQYGRGTTDARSDVYALGATVYALLTGVDPPESIQRVTRDPIMLARQQNPQITLRTGSAIMRALAMDPTQRFQSAADFKAALSPPLQPMARPVNYPAQAPMTTAQPAGSMRSGAFPAGVPPFVWPVGVLLLLALAILAGGRWGVNRATTAGGATIAALPADTLAATLPAPATPVGGALARATTSPTRTQTAGPPTRTPGPSPTPFNYTVQPGDTCSEIAAFYNVSVAEIANLNDLPLECRIFAGQRLRIPSVRGAVISSPTAKYTLTPIQPRSTFVARTDGMAQVYVPAGEFWMGAADDPESSAAEQPAHKVFLRAYWIDRSEVTNAMYARCVAAGACQPPGRSDSKTRQVYYGEPAFDNYPVIFVTWEDAVAYCEWAERRLPTEAEWEKASRGENAGKYPWGETPPNTDRANYNNHVGDTRPVGDYPDGSSAYGAFEMSGNVAEWVADWFSNDYYQDAPFANPPGPENGEFRVIRGGSWYNLAGAMRSTFRLWNYPDLRADTVGFRCAR